MGQALGEARSNAETRGGARGPGQCPLDGGAGRCGENSGGWCPTGVQPAPPPPQQESALKALGTEGLFLFSSLDTDHDMHISPEEFKPIAEKLTGTRRSWGGSPGTASALGRPSALSRGPPGEGGRSWGPHTGWDTSQLPVWARWFSTRTPVCTPRVDNAREHP